MLLVCGIRFFLLLLLEIIKFLSIFTTLATLQCPISHLYDCVKWLFSWFLFTAIASRSACYMFSFLLCFPAGILTGNWITSCCIFTKQLIYHGHIISVIERRKKTRLALLMLASVKTTNTIILLAHARKLHHRSQQVCIQENVKEAPSAPFHPAVLFMAQLFYIML